jgi:glycerophosphoryl diester phosphodiesterase
MKASLLFLLHLMMANQIQAQEPFIVAHRGASKDAPENTLPAFQLAWKQGADAIEGDFFLTKDGRIVCIHDKSTGKYSGVDWEVKEKTLAELRTLDVGAYKDSKFKGTIIPTIAEVFATIPEKKKIYIEVKCGKEIVPTLLREIQTSGLTDEQIVVISFDEEVIREMKIKAPQFKACWLEKFEEDRNGNRKPSLESALETLKDINADGLSSNPDLTTESFVKTIRDQGYEYHVWTVDDPEIAKTLLSWGTQSITTNVPGYLRNHLH